MRLWLLPRIIVKNGLREAQQRAGSIARGPVPILFYILLIAGSRAALAAAGAGTQRQAAKEGSTGQTSEAAARTRPAQLPDDWQSTRRTIPKAALRVWSRKKKSGFGLSIHRALAEKASEKCSESLVSAQYRQDILRQFDATAHFDNCAFEQGFAAIDQEFKDIDDILARKKDPASEAVEAMGRVGRVLHAVQDFYAHSNWVELADQAGAPFDSELVAPIWLEEGRKRVRNTKGLVSGYVWWDGPKECQGDVPSHADMCKDGSDTPRGKEVLKSWKRTAFSAAFETAQVASSSFISWAYDRWPQLEAQCKGELYVTVLPDRRPE